MKKIKLALISEVSEEFAKEWKDLWAVAENATIFNSYEWFKACVESFGIKNYEIYACYENVKLVAILPTAKSTFAGISCLKSLAPKYDSKSTILIKRWNKSLLCTFFEYITAKNNIFLSEVDEKTCAILKKIYPNSLSSIISVNPYITLKDNPFKHMDGSNLNKIINKLKANLEFITHQSYDYRDDLDKCLDIVRFIDQKSTKKLVSKDSFGEENEKEIYRNVIKYCKKYVQIDFLYYKGEPVVFTLGLKWGTIYLGLLTGFLPEYKSLSPGKSLMYLVLKKLSADGMQVFDFGNGNNTYKREFTPHFKLQYNFHLSKNPFIMLWWRFVNFARRSNQILFPKKHTDDHRFLFKTL